MPAAIGMDIGGTKIASALFDAEGVELTRLIVPTPASYNELLHICRSMIADLDVASESRPTIGVGLPGVISAATRELPVIANVPCLSGHDLRADLEHSSQRPVPITNDANCAALSEAIDGAGAGYRHVFGLIMGTGVGGGLVIDGRLVEGANGIAGEIGHLPLPFRMEADGPAVPCACGQLGCIDKTVSGPALARFWHWATGSDLAVITLCEQARHGDAVALDVLDRFYTTAAKAMIAVIHAYDPDIIVVSGGLNNLPGFYEAVPQRWEQFAVVKNLKTRLVPAQHGALSGMRGAAWLGRMGEV